METTSVVGVVAVLVAVAIGFVVGALLAVLGSVRRTAGLELALQAIVRLDPEAPSTGRAAVDLARVALHMRGKGTSRAPV